MSERLKTLTQSLLAALGRHGTPCIQGVRRHGAKLVVVSLVSLVSRQLPNVG